LKSVDKDDSRRYTLRIVACISRKAGCGKKHTSIGLSPVEGSYECLDIGPANCLLRTMSLGLHVDPFETKDVLPDDSVQPLVSAATEVLGGSSLPAIAHCGEEPEN
jgi:hypothetical protein